MDFVIPPSLSGLHIQLGALRLNNSFRETKFFDCSTDFYLIFIIFTEKFMLIYL